MHGEYSWNYFVGAKSCCKKKKTCQLLGSGMSVKKRVSASIAKRGKNFNYV